MTAMQASLALPGPVPLWRHPAFRWTLLLAGLTTLLVLWRWDAAADLLFRVETQLSGLLPRDWIASAGTFVLPALAFGGGLLASLSPCVLPLVPINVALIGAGDVRGWRAVARSGAFVLGAALALSALGLFADLAGFLLIEQRGPVFLGAGMLLVLLGLAFLEVVPLPLSGRAPGGARAFGPLLTGSVFALVTTPCASPLLAAVLTAATALAIPGLTVVTMVAFSLGYTALVFAAGVMGGGLVARLRQRSFEAPRAAAAAALLAAGVGFGVLGLRWF